MSEFFDDWPTCEVRGCGEEFRPGRAKLGYTTCLHHGQLDALNQKPKVLLVDVNKSNPTITSDPRAMLGDVAIGREVQSELRSTRTYVRLEGKEPKP